MDLVEKGRFEYNFVTAPGDYNNDGTLGVPNRSTLPMGEVRSPKLDEKYAKGKLAMMAIIGMLQDGLIGDAWDDWGDVHCLATARLRVRAWL